MTTNQVALERQRVQPEDATSVGLGSEEGAGATTVTSFESAAAALEAGASLAEAEAVYDRLVDA